LLVESLESRQLMTAMPFGAMANDLGEFMLGSVAVTPVLLESNGAIDANIYDWTTQQKSEVLSNIQVGLEWWTQLLAKKSSVHSLTWQIDTTYLDSPVPTSYEPITRISNDYTRWVPEFLSHVGFSQESTMDANIRRFNDSQRQKLGSDWSFTIFVVNSAPEQLFAPGGSFSRAFAFAGGLYFVTPSNRGPSTYTHETGHMFWARDEYRGGGNYYQRRGYYDSQNLNAYDLNPDPNFRQAASIMSAGVELDAAFLQVETAAATLAQIGWQDSDNDGIFDVLDVPLELKGIGRLDPARNEYHFLGTASAKTLPNRNGFGLQNDITLNRIGRIEYRLQPDSAWTTAHSYAIPAYQANVDIRIPLGNQAISQLEIRAIDPRTGITSNVFQGSLQQPDVTADSGITGFVWADISNDGSRQWNEPGLAGWLVQLVDASGRPVDLQGELEPDALPLGPIDDTDYPAVRIRAVGNDADGSLQVANDSRASTGTKVFSPYSPSFRDYVAGWRDDQQNLEVTFDVRQASVAVDVIGFSSQAYARLEAFSATGQLLERKTSVQLAIGQTTTLSLQRSSPEIAYIVVKGHLGTMIGIDQIRFGSPSQTLSGGSGEYYFPGLLPGSYQVLVTPESGYSMTSSPAGPIPAQVTAGQATAHIDHGFHRPSSPWQNPMLATDVSNDGAVAPQDVLLAINALRRHGSILLDDHSLPPQPYVDVDGDRQLSPLDVLVVINYLRRQSGGSGEAEGPSPGIMIIPSGVYGASADGEAAPSTTDELSSTLSHHFADRGRFDQPNRSRDRIAQPSEARLSDPASLPRQLSRRRLLSSRAEERSLAVRELAFAYWPDVADA
jgi:hypothetical protein